MSEIVEESVSVTTAPEVEDHGPEASAAYTQLAERNASDATSAAGAAAEGAEVSVQAATVAQGAAEEAASAASESQRTLAALEALAARLDNLPNQIRQSLGPPAHKREAIPDEEETPAPKARKPDKAPPQTHWYYRKIGGRK